MATVDLTPKLSVILTCEYDKAWNAPNGDIIHYHRLTLQNGESGNVGVAEKFHPKIGPGMQINYSINGNKIKLLEAPAPAQTANASNTKNNAAAKDSKGTKPQTWGKAGPKKIDDFLGYTFGYAKDLTIAKIQTGDKKAQADPAGTTIEYAHRIYAEIKGMLKEDWVPPPAPSGPAKKAAKETGSTN